MRITGTFPSATSIRGLAPAALWGLLLAACSNTEAPEPKAQVSAGKEVTLEYTLRLDDDEVYDSNVGAVPLVYTHGNGELVPGLEAALEGMEVDERKHVVVEPKRGYGPADPGRVQEVPIFLVAPDAREPGTEIQTRGPHGETLYMKVKEVKGDTVVMDMNHPLAGKTLYFDVKVVAIR